MIQRIRLIHRFKKLHQLILWQEFVQSIDSDQMFISGKMVFHIALNYNKNDHEQQNLPRAGHKFSALPLSIFLLYP